MCIRDRLNANQVQTRGRFWDRIKLFFIGDAWGWGYGVEYASCLFYTSMAIVIIGFLLMTGPTSSETSFEPDIFSVRRIKVAPVVCLFGFLSMIYAVLRLSLIHI